MNYETIHHHCDTDEIPDFFEESPEAIHDLDEVLAKSIQENEADRASTETDAKAYQLYVGPHLGENEIPFQKVVGHEEQKKELLAVLDWFNRSEELKSKGLSIPHGCLLSGEMGNGKSMLIREFIRCVDVPVFLFKGSDNHICDDIRNAFDEARKCGRAVIVFDELDLLIDRDRRIVRALQECLDGVESSDGVLVLAATNNPHSIPDALQRPGRLEKKICIPYPSGEEAVALLKRYFEEFGVALPEDFDQNEMELAFNEVSCAGIKAIVNDVLLRNGFEGITSDMIHDAILRSTQVTKGPEQKPIMDICIHEASHLLMCAAYPQFFTAKRLYVDGPSGAIEVKEVVEGYWPYDKAIADIQIAMAGMLGQKLICKTASRGCESDLQRARIAAYNLFNISGYSSAWETLPAIMPNARMETPWKRRRMERKIERFLKKIEHRTSRYLKSHERQIRLVAEELFKKQHLRSSEILVLLNAPTKTPSEVKTQPSLTTPAMAYSTKSDA